MRIVFIGAGEIGVSTLQALLRSSEHRLTGVITQPDKPVGRTQQIEPPPIKRALAGTKMSILQPVRIKGREAIAEVRALRPEAIVVMAYGQILPRDLLEIPPVACLNLHASLLAKGNAPRIPQDNALATYAPKLTRDDGKIDWSEPAEIIERKIRAFNPWPGAFITTSTNGTRNLKIFSATVVDFGGKPGEILRRKNELLIAAGKGALSLGEVQLEGKRRMSATEFSRGHASILRAAH